MTKLHQVSKAYSVFEVKAVDEEKRQLRGIATTPSTDRVGDVVIPEGAEFRLPIPFLWQHDHRQPIGNVIEAKVMPGKGIEVTIQLVKLTSPSQLAARLEEAWESIKSGLVRGLSIGFSPIKYAWLDSGGMEFQEWSFNELSAVTVPCNAEANITSIKSLSEQALALVRHAPVKMAVKSVGVPTTPVKTVTPEEGQKMNIAEQIEAYKATLAGKQKEMNTLMEKSATSGETLNAEDAQAFEQLEADCEAVAKHIERLQKMQALQIDKAAPVDQTPGFKAVATTRSEPLPAVAKQHEKLQPGQEFARYAMCLAAGKGNVMQSLAIAQKAFPRSERIANTLKAAVEAGTTTADTWAKPLVEYRDFAGDFIEYLRPQTILGRFGRDGIPELRNVPFNVRIKGQTSGGNGYWVGEGQAKPLTKFDFNDVFLGIAKVANIAVLTEELIRLSDPSAEILVRNALAEALIERLDIDFIDPNKAAVANVSPASITNGVTPIPSSGGDADAVRVDVNRAMAQFVGSNIRTTSAVWIMSALTVLNLSTMTNALGQPEYPGLSLNGGTFFGLPVIVSQYVQNDSSGSIVVLASASDIFVADDNIVVIDSSREASLLMDSAPNMNSTTPTGAPNLVSMFQTDSVALRAERYINWMKRRADAVAVISDVNWGQ